MRRVAVWWIALLALVAFATDVPPPIAAWGASGVVIVNPNCGASPSPSPSSGQQVTYVDQNGNACVSGSGGGGGSVTQGTTPWLVAPIPTSASANAIAPVVTSAAAGSLVLKGSAGNLYDAYVTTGGTSGFLMVFNLTSAPSDGAVTPQECIAVGANATQSLFVPGTPPESYSTGITAVFSSTGCYTKTVSATAFLHGRVQ